MLPLPARRMALGAALLPWLTLLRLEAAPRCRVAAAAAGSCLARAAPCADKGGTAGAAPVVRATRAEEVVPRAAGLRTGPRPQVPVVAVTGPATRTAADPLPVQAAWDAARTGVAATAGAAGRVVHGPQRLPKVVAPCVAAIATPSWLWPPTPAGVGAEAATVRAVEVVELRRAGLPPGMAP